MLEKNDYPIDQVWAWVSFDAKGNEGILAAQTPMGWLPLVSGKKSLVEGLMRQVAQRVSEERPEMGIRLIRLARADVVETLKELPSDDAKAPHPPSPST